MTRKETRENLYIMLFRLDFHNDDDLKEQAEMYLEDLNASAKIKAELRDKFIKVMEHLTEIDAKIEEKSKGWRVERIAKAELTVLRLGIFELLYVDSVPSKVAINEAVELAKAYGGEKASGFVNGILASVVRELDNEEKKTDGEN